MPHHPDFLRLATLGAATLTASLGNSIASVMLPVMTVSFDASVSQARWIILAFLLTLTVSVVTVGRLGDQLGHRRVLLAGLGLFTLASGAAALAPGLGLLIGARAVQGAAAAALIALPMSLARDLIGPDRIGTAMGLLGTVSAVGTALGPSSGGLILSVWGWAAGFWLLTGAGTASLLLAMIALPPDRMSPRPQRLVQDVPGSLALVLALASFALFSSGETASFGLPLAAPLGLSLLGAAGFVLIERRRPDPLVPLAVLADRRVGLGIVMNVTVGAIMMSTLVIGPFVLAFALGLSPLQIGLVLAVGPVVSALSGLPSGKATDRFGPARVTQWGLAQMVVGLIALALLPRVLGTVGYVIALTMLTPAFQLFLAANNSAVLLTARPDQRGVMSGLLGLSRNLGLMTGASALSLLFVTILGTSDIDQASAEAVARAFTGTFLFTATLAGVTLGLSVWAATSGSRRLR